MKKVSQNLGITKSCPDCGRVLIKNSNFTGTGYFYVMCPFCYKTYDKKVYVRVDVISTTSINLTKILMIALLIIVGTFFVAGLHIVPNNYVDSIVK